MAPLEITKNEDGVDVVKVGDKEIPLAEAEALLGQHGVPDDFDEKVFEVKVDGKPVRMTGAELVTAASKSKGADKRFKEASEKAAVAEDAIRRTALEDKIRAADMKDWDLAEIRELARLSKMSSEDADKYVEYVEKVQAGEITPEGQPVEKSTKPDEQVSKTDLALKAQLDKTQKDLDALKKSRAKEVDEKNRGKIKEVIRNALTKDSELGTIMKEDTPLSKKLPEAIFNEVRNRVAFGEDGESWGPELLEAVLQEKRQELKEYGILGDKAKHDAQVSLGIAPSLSPDVLQVDKPIPYVPPTGDKGKESFINALRQKVLKHGGNVSG